MIIDLVQRVYNEKAKGNLSPITEFDEWLEISLKKPGTAFVVDGQIFFWKIISAKKFEHIISVYETDWMLIHSEAFDIILLGNLTYGHSNLLGERDLPRLGSFWLFKSRFDGLQISDEPLHIVSPHYFTTPKHRIEGDMAKLIRCLMDKDIEITKYVDYKTHRANTMRIR